MRTASIIRRGGSTVASRLVGVGLHHLRGAVVGTLALTLLTGFSSPTGSHGGSQPKPVTSTSTTRTLTPPKSGAQTTAAKPRPAPAASTSKAHPKGIGTRASSTLSTIGTVTASPVPSRVGNTTASAPPANRTGAGDTLRWVVNYEKTSPEVASATITDALDKARHTYVPDSLTSPPGSIQEWSSDGGTTYVPVDQGAATDHVRVIRPDVDAAALIPAPPAGGFSAALGGDGYNVAFFDNNVYSVYHHNASSIVDCHDKSTGVRCPGYTKTFSGNTGQTPDAVVFSHYLFWAPVFSDRAIVHVLDLNTGLLAATTDTGPGVTIGSHNSSKDGWAVGTNFYFLSENDTINCISMISPFAACPGQPYSLALPGDPNIDTETALADGGHLLPFGNRIYVVAERLVDETNTVYLTCFDTTTTAVCAGTALVDLTTDFAAAISSAMPFNRVTALGADGGVCVQPVVGATIRCYNTALVYQPGDPYAALATAFPVIITWNGTGQGPIVDGTKIYLPMANQGLGNEIGCFDWATAATCNANFPFSTVTRWGEVTQPYTLQADPVIPNCLWENGNNGRIVPFDGTTGLQGCANTQAGLNVNPDAFFCDGQTGHVTGWSAVTITSLFLLQGGSIQVTVRDNNGVVVPGFNAIAPTSVGPGTWSVDLSTIPFSGATTVLTVEVVVLDGDPISWTSGQPRVAVTWTGDQFLQVCFDTTVQDLCPPNALATPEGVAIAFISTDVTSETTDAAGTDTQLATAAFDYLYNDACFAYHVSKSVDVTTATLYQPVNYTTTIINTGIAPLTAISVTDDVSGWQANATLVPGSLTASVGTVTGPSGGVITWTGDLGVGETATVMYRVTVNRTAAAGSILTNTDTPDQPYGTCEATPPPTTLPVNRLSITQEPTACHTEVVVEVPTLTISQQVCHSDVVANCRQGGSGPWVSETVVTVGAPAYWRVTVTNPSHIDIAGIVLVDLQGGSNCAAVAGTFALTAGASRQFFCSTPNVRSTTTNIVSTQFTPPFAPPGTPPLRFGPTEAIAEVLPPPLPITGVALHLTGLAGVSLILIGIVLLGLAALAWRRREAS
jgi:uncharacterized repeat protein (TIGR01451 family)